MYVYVTVPTFIEMLREVESPEDVMSYVTDCLGYGKEIQSFVKQFLDRRSVLVSGASESVTVTTTTVFSSTAAKKAKKKQDEATANVNKIPVKQPVSKQNSLEFTEVKVIGF